MPRFLITLMLLATMLAGITGCQSLVTEQERTLYGQLGERKGIAQIVEDLLYLIIEDSRINYQFKGTDVAQFHQNLTDQLCALSGGPCTYNGKEMRKVHEDMTITDTQFNALGGDFILAMDKNDIPTGAQNRLLKQLVPLHPDIRNL